MSGAALKRVLSRAQMRLADRSDACEGPGWARTEHMQQESGYVGGVPKMAAGAEAFLEDAGCWQASLQNARELLEAAGARERARVGGSGRRVDCPRAWLAPGSPEEGTTPRPAKEERWLARLFSKNSYSTRAESRIFESGSRGVIRGSCTTVKWSRYSLFTFRGLIVCNCN